MYKSPLVCLLMKVLVPVCSIWKSFPVPTVSLTLSGILTLSIELEIVSNNFTPPAWNSRLSAVTSCIKVCPPAPSKLTLPNEPVEVIEPLIFVEPPPSNEPLTNVASGEAVTPVNWEPSPISAPNEPVEVIEPLIFEWTSREPVCIKSPPPDLI